MSAGVVAGVRAAGGLLDGGRWQRRLGGRLYVAHAHRHDVGRRQVRRAGRTQRHAASSVRRRHRRRQKSHHHRHQDGRQGRVGHRNRNYTRPGVGFKSAQISAEQVRTRLGPPIKSSFTRIHR